MIIRWDDIAKISAPDIMQKLASVTNEFVINYESGFTITFILRASYKEKKVWEEVTNILKLL